MCLQSAGLDRHFIILWITPVKQPRAAIWAKFASNGAAAGGLAVKAGQCVQ